MIGRYDSFRAAYNELFRIFQHAHCGSCTSFVRLVEPRGKKTLEFSPCYFSIDCPRQRLVYHAKRRFNLMHAINESLLLFNSEVSTVEDYPFVPMGQFSDDGLTLPGSYGWRIVPLIGDVLNKLREDKDSRQAVIPVLRASDFCTDSKDVPCTETVQFMIRDGKLDCFVNMRSNDFFWGLPYDVFQFTVLHEVVANTLGVGLGRYHHYTASMHVYEWHFGWLESIEWFRGSGFDVGYSVGQMQWLCKAFQGLFAPVSGATSANNFAYSLICNDILPPFSTLLRNELKYREGGKVPELPVDMKWAEQYTKRWRKNVV